MADRRLTQIIAPTQDATFGNGLMATGAAVVLADALRDALNTGAFAATDDGSNQDAASAANDPSASADSADGNAAGGPNNAGFVNPTLIGVQSIPSDVTTAPNQTPGETATDASQLAVDPAPSHDPGTDGAYVAPAAVVENELVDQFHTAIEGVSDNAGQPADTAVHSLTSFGENMGMGHIGQPGWDGGPNPLTAALNIPDTTINGDGPQTALGDFFTEVPDALAFTGSFARENVANASLDDPGGVGLLESVTGSAGDGHLLSADSGDIGGNGSLLGDAAGTGSDGGDALLGDLLGLNGGGGDGDNFMMANANGNRDQSGAIVDAGVGSDQHNDPSSAEHASHLIDVGTLPFGDNDDVGNVNVLASPGEGQQQAADLHAIDNQGDGPRLVDADVLTNDEYAVPSTGTVAPANAPATDILAGVLGTGDGIGGPLLAGNGLDLPLLAGDGFDALPLGNDLGGAVLGADGPAAQGLIPQVVALAQDHDFALI